MKLFACSAKEEDGDEKIRSMVNSYKIDAISIGNGRLPAKQSFFIKKIAFDKPLVFIVSEAGASVYSASKIARESLQL
jgi:uncharacterized protein